MSTTTNMSRSSSTKGYTLIEMLVYIAIVSVALLALIQSMLRISTSYENVKAVRVIEQAAIATMDRMQLETRSAASINVASSTFNTNPGVLALNTTNSRVRFYVSNNRLYLEEGGVVTGPLTETNVTVSSFVVRQITATSSSAVKIEMTLQASGYGTTTVSKNFYTTTILRGSYE